MNKVAHKEWLQHRSSANKLSFKMDFVEKNNRRRYSGRYGSHQENREILDPIFNVQVPAYIAVKNLGVFSSTTLNFISELGRRICVHAGDARETSYLFQQRISITLQRFNCVLCDDTEVNERSAVIAEKNGNEIRQRNAT